MWPCRFPRCQPLMQRCPTDWRQPLGLRRRIGAVRNRIAGDLLRMLAYNGSIPGPTLHVDQGSEITVHVTNDGDVEATVHWHGLRLENRYDGVPHETQEPIPIGGTFRCKLQFPDAGFYWYHPHVREDFGLEMGLYGTIVVEPTDASYWPAVDRQLTITLDDLLIEDGHVAPFLRSGPTYTAMGRFGNVMLTNGQTVYAGEAAVGEVVRLYVVNTANTRIFNFAVRGARMKLVGGDSGRYEQETFVDEVLLSPSERRSSTCCSMPRAMCGLSTARPIGCTTWAGSPWPTALPVGRPHHSTYFAWTRSFPTHAGRSTMTCNAHRTRCWRSSPACRCCTAPRPSPRRRTRARCIRRSLPPSPAHAPSAA